MNRKTASTAIQLTKDLDRIADVIRKQGSVLGLPKDIVRDFQARCANVSAIVNSEVSGRWDATQIGGSRKVEMADATPEDQFLHTYYDTQDEFTGAEDLTNTTLRVAKRYLSRR